MASPSKGNSTTTTRLDVDDDAGVEEAPALLTGGTPWLLPGRYLTVQPASGRTFPAEGTGALTCGVSQAA